MEKAHLYNINRITALLSILPGTLYLPTSRELTAGQKDPASRRDACSFRYQKGLINVFLILLFCMLITITEGHADVLQAPKTIGGNAAAATNQPVKAPEITVLVHGLMRTSLSMYPLRFFLERQGYQVYLYSYPSTRYTIHEHGIALNRYINKLLSQHPDSKINFVTHSLGGIIARDALAQLSESQLQHIGSLIMLAPPNQGSSLAKFSTRVFPFVSPVIKPLKELSSDRASYVHRVPVPKVRIGIIAGRYDAKVAPVFARLQGQEAPVIVNSTHTFIMNNGQTKKLILHFLQKGTFNG